MRLLVLVHEYPPVGGGGGRVAQDIAEGLAARGHRLTVLTSHWKGLPRREDRRGVTVLRLPVARKEPYRAGLLSMMLYVTRSILHGGRLLRRVGFDLMHVHFAVPAGAAAWVLHRLYRVPYVLTVHLGDVPGGVPQKTGRWFRWIYPFTPPIWRDAARVVAVSQYTKTLASRAYRVPIQVIPNGVDLDALRPRDLTPHRPPHILFVGRFVPQKNPGQVVEILAGLQDLPWRCTMLGDGPLRAQVRARLRELGLEHRFHLPGWVTPEEVLATMDRADLLLMPSRQEGLPVVGVQALAKGLALVVSRAGGFPELVNAGENGYAIPDPEDTAAFRQALRSLLENPERLARARRASLRLAERFDLKRVVQAYETLFRQVLEGR